MCEDDFFRFVPADNGIYDDIVLITPDQETKYSKHFTGIIKTGNKCLPHSKLNPKQRRKIENFDIEEDGYILPATADRILWSDEIFNIAQLTNRSFEDIPSVIKVASNCSKFSCAELSFGQNCLVHSFGTESRILGDDITSSKRIEIPRNLECQVVWKGKQLTMKEVLVQDQTPIKVKVVHCNGPVNDLNGHVILLKGEVECKFIVCSLINAGWIDQSGLLVIPEAGGTKFRIGEGLRDGGGEEWKDFVGMLKRSVRHLNKDVKGYPEITMQDLDIRDVSSSLADSKTQLPCYENVEINLMVNSNLKHVDSLKPFSVVYENVQKDDEPKNETLDYPTFIRNNVPENDSTAIPSPPKPVIDASSTPSKQSSTHESKSQQNSVLNKEDRQPLFKRFMKLNPQETPIKNKDKKTPPPHPSPRCQPTPKQSEFNGDSSTRVEMFVYPDKLEGLSCVEVMKCFKGLGLGGYCKNNFDVDGRTLTNMDVKDLENILNMTPFDANKVSRFIRGWRP